MNNSVVVWKEPTGTIVPRDADSALAIATVAKSLSLRDQKQIVTAFQSEAFEMMAGFVLNKALSQLKRALASLGMAFVGEMLGRADLDEDSVPTVSISNYEAITLARELGLINSTDAKRLTQHLELLAHFDSLNIDDADIEEMTREEALSFLRTCVNAVLGREGNIAPVEFVAFRDQLESRTFKKTDSEVTTLLVAPYFFQKTTLSILLANIKTKSGAQFEHTLGNTVVLIPALWEKLRDAEKWAIGQSYAEAVNAGLSPAVLALKKSLTSVQGFDFVPESLRSQTFAAAAANVISMHTGMNNFYNEPAAILALAKLGTTIPWPAFPICMSAVLAVKLGNQYGVSNVAQSYTKSLLDRLTDNQWEYYLNECLRGDVLILQKLAWYDKTQVKWLELINEFSLNERTIKFQEITKLLNARNKSLLEREAIKLLAKTNQ
ncbi:hypothetical protein [Methylocucumis oryzae]|uniref:Uncharacterized protein n=1 Tax=Methylocucumis oryzae TaxID=1632867 RepID=A0A0F3IHY2_9GAMM|nr:hypothetical protein [Methylocucumis oryzae]KJV06361.1 hypothetical protein VZ94_11775 [Methylocucumis oryzae]